MLARHLLLPSNYKRSETYKGDGGQDKLFDRDARERAEQAAEEELQRGMDLGRQTILPKLNEGYALAANFGVMELTCDLQP